MRTQVEIPHLGLWSLLFPDKVKRKEPYLNVRVVGTGLEECVAENSTIKLLNVNKNPEILSFFRKYESRFQEVTIRLYCFYSESKRKTS